MNSRDIQNLRKKFIYISVFSLFITMLCIGSAIFFSSYVSMRRAVSVSLTELVENEGSPADTDSSKENGKIKPDGIHVHSLTEAFRGQYNKYKHYYSVRFDSGGNVLSVKTDDEDSTASQYAEEIFSNVRQSGHYGDYYYNSKVYDDGSKLICFLDCSAEMIALTRLLYSIIVIYLAGLLISYLLMRALSLRAIQPEIENVKRQKEFITNASHELKTPLAVIRANTELEQMLYGEDEWNQSTINQIDRMSALIQNLVIISRESEREDKSELEEIDFSAAVRESALSFASVARQEGRSLEINVPSGIRMLADSSKIRQLTTLLVDNAVKYCDEGGKIEVTAGQIKNGRGAALTVSNSYAEGADVDYSRFFERFYRQDSSHNIDKGGYGIGLSLAESICSQYGGDIRAQWKDGVISFICQLF